MAAGHTIVRDVWVVWMKDQDETYKAIFQDLKKIGILDVEGYARFTAPFCRDLDVEVLSVSGGVKVIVIGHHYNLRGAVMCDPEMEVRVFEEDGMAEALTLRQDGTGLYMSESFVDQMEGLRLFLRVYPEPGEVNLQLKQHLNSSLNEWLRNIIEHGFKPGNETQVGHNPKKLV